MQINSPAAFAAGLFIIEPLVLFLKFCMCSITEWWIFGVFATAEMYSFGFFGCKGKGIKRRTLMWAITERLGATSSAGTPVISFALLNFYRIRAFLCYFRFFHNKNHLSFIVHPHCIASPNQQYEVFVNSWCVIFLSYYGIIIIILFPFFAFDIVSQELDLYRLTI